MVQLLILLRQSLFVTLLNVDHAIYMTSMVEGLPIQKQRKAIAWGIDFTPVLISLFVAGSFLMVKSSNELYRYLKRLEDFRQFRLSVLSFPR
ncbi:MAG: hypothetical protein AB4040_09660 [Synechococcus sp.]